MVYGSQYVLCPFYKDETVNTIRCEGLISEACSNNFQNKGEKQAHWENFCCKHYELCPYAQKLYEKY